MRFEWLANYIHESSLLHDVSSRAETKEKPGAQYEYFAHYEKLLRYRVKTSHRARIIAFKEIRDTPFFNSHIFASFKCNNSGVKPLELEGREKRLCADKLRSASINKHVCTVKTLSSSLVSPRLPLQKL